MASISSSGVIIMKFVDTEDKTSDTINQDIQSMQQFALPEYLVFLIMGHIKELRKVAPDHVLVKAVEEILEQELAPPDDDAPQQLDLFS